MKNRLFPVMTMGVFLLALSGCPTAGSTPTPEPGTVHIGKVNGSYVLYRNSQPYTIKGVGGQYRLDLAAASGANSTRTWDTEGGQAVLDLAQSNGMTVFMGLWLSQAAADYQSDFYKASVRARLQTALDQFKNHPALLVWAIGNEINNSQAADTQAAWSFVQELAGMIHAQDKNHPVATVISTPPWFLGTLSNIVHYAPGIEMVGVNAYAGITLIGSYLNLSPFKGPYVITEWGVNGFWEVATTSWGRPIEETSAEKAADYSNRYALISAHSNVVLGSYVFLWGQKQERTPTWFGMFAETNNAVPGLDGESFPSADIMQYCWTGAWPTNRAPNVTGMTLDERAAADSIILTNTDSYTVSVSANDPDGDPLTYIWEILNEPTELGTGGSYEPRPARYSVTNTGNNSLAIMVTNIGEYRVFVYVKDDQGHVGSANIPFRVTNE